MYRLGSPVADAEMRVLGEMNTCLGKGRMQEWGGRGVSEP